MPSPSDLVDLLAQSAGATRSALDQHCTVTAVMIERATPDGGRQDVLVEILHDPDAVRGRQWMLTAFDELTDRQLGPCYGADIHDLVRGLAWSELDSSRAPCPD